MSFNVRSSGKAKDVEAGLERAGEGQKAGRNGFEQKAIDLIVEAGTKAVKHASVDDDAATGAHKSATVEGSGHFDAQGVGSFRFEVQIGQVAGGHDKTKPAPEVVE